MLIVLVNYNQNIYDNYQTDIKPSSNVYRITVKNIFRINVKHLSNRYRMSIAPLLILTIHTEFPETSTSISKSRSFRISFLFL